MRGRKPRPIMPDTDADQGPPPAIPTCPPILKGEARREWRRVTRLLFELGTIAHLDRAVLTTYCQAWADWLHAKAEISKTAAVIKSTNGFAITNPWVGIANGAFKQMRAAIAELGLSPVARARFAAGQKQKPAPRASSPWDGLLAGMGHAN